MWFLCVPLEFELEISMPMCMNQIKSNHFILISHSVKCSVNLLVVCTLSFSPNSFFEIKKIEFAPNQTFKLTNNPNKFHAKIDKLHLVSNGNGNENAGATSRQCVSAKQTQSQSQPFTNGTPSYSPKAERTDFNSSRPICLDFVSSFGSSTFNRETMQSNGSSLNFMDYRDFNGNSPHSSYAMFAAQSEYPPPPPPNGYAGYNHAYHYSNPYINPSGTNYPLAVAGDYNPNSFGMPPPQHLPQDIKIPKDR